MIRESKIAKFTIEQAGGPSATDSPRWTCRRPRSTSGAGCSGRAETGLADPGAVVGSPAFIDSACTGGIDSRRGAAHLPPPGWRRATNRRAYDRAPLSFRTRRPSGAGRRRLRRRRPRPIRRGWRIHREVGSLRRPRHGRSALRLAVRRCPGSADRWCGSAAYSTIQSAVNAAPPGGTVIVCPGTYTEHVVISSPLTLVRQGRHHRRNVDQRRQLRTSRSALPAWPE